MCISNQFKWCEEKHPGEGNGYQFQYSCLENPMDRGAWWATVHGIIKLDKTEIARIRTS